MKLLGRALAFSFPAALPFCYTWLLIDPSLSLKLLFISLWNFASLLWITFDLFRKEDNQLPLNTYAVLWAAWLLFSAITISYSINVADGLYDWIKWLSIGIALFNLSYLVRSGHLNDLLKGVLFTSLFSVLVTLAQVLPLIPDVFTQAELTYYITGLSAHKNLFSSWLMMLMPLQMIAAVRLPNRFWEVSALLLLLLTVASIVVIQTRAVWVALLLSVLLSLLVVVVLLFKNKQLRNKLRAHLNKYGMLWLVTCCVLLAAPVAFNPHFLESTLHRVERTIHYDKITSQEGATIHERFFLWNNTWQLIKEAPVSGHGAASWRALYPKYGLKDSRSEQGFVHFQRPHNDFLWVWSEKGLPGLLLFLALFLWPWLWQFRQLAVEISIRNSVHRLSIMLGMVMFGINAFFDFPAERVGHLALLAVLISTYPVGAPQRRFNPGGLLATLLFVSVLSLIPAVLRVHGEYRTRQLYVIRNEQFYLAQLDMASAAQSFIYNTDPVSQPMAHYKALAYYNMQRYADALPFYKEAHKMQPFQISIMNNLASTFVKLQQPDSAVVYYKRALGIAPRFEESLVNVAALHYNQRQLDSAYHYIRQVPLNSNMPAYGPALNAILRVKANQLYNTHLDDDALAQCLLQFAQDADHLKATYELIAAHSGLTFEEQLLKDCGK